MAVLAEDIEIEEGPTQMTIVNIGDSFVLDHPTNGVLDTSALDASNLTSGVGRVVNPNNIYHEHFRFSTFNDTAKTNGTFSTTYFNVSLTSGQVFHTLDIFRNLQSVTASTIYADLDGPTKSFAVDSGGGKIIILTEGQ